MMPPLYASNGLLALKDIEALAQPAQFAALLRAIVQPEWVVYAKRPFAGPKQVTSPQ